MNAFHSARMVEDQAMVILRPFLRERAAKDGEFVLIEKGPLAKRLQETVGDLLYHKPGNGLRSIELKAEERYTGNLFLETWSNHCFEDADCRADHPPNPGWLAKTAADYLWYYFIDSDYLFVCGMMSLQRWAYGLVSIDGNRARIIRQHLYDDRYTEVVQTKRQQKNRTAGRLVPIADLKAALPTAELRPRQILIDLAEAQLCQDEVGEGARP